MKRKISNICLLLVLILMPVFALAETCTTPSIAGSASSSAGSSPGAGGCSSPHCLATNNQEYVGVRFQIYKYNSGAASTIELVGKGVDVWSTKDFTTGYYSSPSTPNLRIKASCTNVDKPKYGDGHLATHPLSWKQYVDSGQVKYDSALGGRFANGTLNSYALTHNNKKPTGGWLANNLLNKLINGKASELKEVRDLFGLTEKQLNDLMSNTDDYYITAEVLYRFRTSDLDHCENTSANEYQCNPYKNALKNYPNTFFYGTVSENANAHGNKYIYDSLYISNGSTTAKDPDVPKIVGSSYFIKKVGPTDATTDGKNAYIEGGDYYAKQTACNYARGYAVWNIKNICWECGYTCESSCKYTTSGTQERAACATSWCGTNQPDSFNACFNACTNIPVDEGCGNDIKKCSEYQSDPKNIEKKTATCDDKLDSDKKGKTETVSAKICYDDNKSFGDNKDLETYNKTKYYKIICDDEMILSSLPNKPTLYLSEGKTGNIHFSYMLTYNKKCNLFFKTNKKYRELKGNSGKHWFIPKDEAQYKDYSKVYEDISGLKKAITEANKELSNLKAAQKIDTTNERIAKNIKIQETAVENYKNTIKTLEKMYTTARSRLDVLIKEKNAEELKVNEVKLKTYKYNKKSEFEDIPIDLIPLTCTPIKSSSTEKEKFLCLINGYEGTGEKETITINGIDYQCNGEGGNINQTVNGGNTQYYDEVIVYSVPDSYVSAHTNTSGSVFHTEKNCEDNVKAANGFCKVVEYGYTFPEFDGTNLDDYIKEVNNIPSKLTFSVAGGLCDELAFDYNCDYKVEGEYCTECKGFVEGSEEYKKCYEEKCSCDAYCGSDIVCRNKYCPKYCEGCNWKTVSTQCTDCEKICGNITNKDSKEYNTCFYDQCCTNQCDGNCACTYNCCNDKCKALYAGNETKLKECNSICDKELKSCTTGGSEYIYRNISLNNPFPERGTSTGNIGNNWYGKENFITNADEDAYRDETDGKSDKYEYSIEINSKQLKEIKKKVATKKSDETGYKDSTSYKSFGNSKVYVSAVDSRAYCSEFIHQDLTDIIGEKNYHETADATMNCRTR